MNILIKPIITEKSMKESKQSRFTFAVNPFATKPQIKSAIKDQFGVNVLSIRTIINKGTTKRNLKARSTRRNSNWKKAVIKLAPGQKIDLFETGNESTQSTA